MSLIDELCKRLEKTRNATVIPLNLRKYFISTSLSSKVDRMFSTLIQNLRRVEGEHERKQLGGVSRMIKYTKGDISIYLFGEMWYKDGCLDESLEDHFLVLLDTLCHESPTYIDFFIEYERVDGFFPTDCNRNISKVHPIDIDVLGESDYIRFYRDLVWHDWRSSPWQNWRSSPWSIHYEFIVKMDAAMRSEEYGRDMATLLLSDRTMLKALGQSKDVKEFIDKGLKVLDRSPQKLMNIRQYMKKLKRRETLTMNELQSIAPFLNKINDILHAMFSLMNIKMSTSFLKNIIFYGDDGHVQEMSRYMEGKGFIKKEESINKEINCIDVSEIEFPLFNLA